MSRTYLRAATATVVTATVLLLAGMLIAPPLLFWALGEYVKREGSLL